MTELGLGQTPGVAVQVADEGGTRLITLVGEIDQVSVACVRSALETAIGPRDQRVIFDLHRLDFMDSSGIALLIGVTQRLQQVELRRPTPIVRRVIELTGLARLATVTS